MRSRGSLMERIVRRDMLLLTAALCIAMRCNHASDVNTGGGNTSEVSRVVSGVFYESGGDRPAEGAAVELRSREFVPALIAALRPPENPPDTLRRSTMTDRDGRFRFENIPAGLFVVEGRAANDDCALIDSVRIDSSASIYDSVMLPPKSLGPPGAITGVRRPYDTATVMLVYIPGMNVLDTLDGGDTFSLTGLPAGTYVLHFVESGAGALIDTLPPVTTEAGDTTIIGVVYRVIYDGNGNNSGEVPIDTINYAPGDSAVIMPNTGGLVKTGHAFAEWNTAADGGGADRLPGSKVTIGTVDIRLFAKWTINRYSVTFDSRGRGVVPKQTVNYNDTIPTPAAPVRSGYVFTGWFSDPACTGVWIFSTGKVIADTMLYAGWQMPPREMVRIASKDSSFLMGEAVVADTVHTVTFHFNYRLAATEVTQSEYETVMSAAYPSYRSPAWDFGSGADYPAYNIRYYDIVLFCNALTKAEGGIDTVYIYEGYTGTPGDTDFALGGFLGNHGNTGYRLPTEAEWEYACRGGTITRYFWGEDTSTASDYAWYTGNTTGIRPVRQKTPNPLGLFDVAGNVAELVDDYYGLYYSRDVSDPTGPGPEFDVQRMVIRGGSCMSGVRELGCANRDTLAVLGKSPVVGFRLCRSGW